MKSAAPKPTIKVTSGTVTAPLDYASPATQIAEPSHSISLEGMHGTIDVPHHKAGFWKQWRAYAGPALLVSVGYMDPGNWGTDLQAGARYKYDLLWVVAAASLRLKSPGAIVETPAFLVEARS